MDRSAATLLEFISRLTYNVEGLSGDLRLYLSQFLTFHFSKTLSRNHIQDIENSKASRPLTDEREIAAAASNLTTEEKCWAVASVELLRAEAERLDDRVVSRKLAVLIKDLVRILELSDSSSLIAAHRKAIEEEIHKYEERPVVRIPAAIWPLSLDFFLRCAFLFYLGTQNFESSLKSWMDFIIIPGIVIALVIFHRRRNRKANFRLLESYGGADNFKTEFRVTATQYTWLAFYLIAGTFINYLLAGTHQWSESLHLIGFVLFALYYSVYIRFFNVGRINENDLVRQLDEREQRTDTLDVDENDAMIVRLETRLNSSTSRLDAYVLESALFGALTFGGFLQIMASDLVSFDDLETFASSIFNTSRALVHQDVIGVENGLTLLNDKVSLFCLVSVESLVCSIFFVAVIASRLRFSDIADRVRTAIDLASAFNEKEEALYHESETSDIRQSRLQELTAKVNRQLFEASQSLLRISPVMAYMQYFRNAGILVFVIILITSSLFITSVLGWTFLALVGATYLYFNRELINKRVKSTLLRVRLVFLRKSRWLLAVAIAPFVVAMVLRNSFHWMETQTLEALGFFLVGLHMSIWLLLAAHYDQEFGDIEKKENHRRLSRWNIVRNLMAAMIFLFGTGMAFKVQHLMGADEMTMVSASMISFLMYFTGYYLSRIRWLGVISGWMLATVSTGILFKILHFTGGQEMLILGTIFSFASSVLGLWKRGMFHSLYLRFCLVLLFISFTNVTELFTRMELAYAHRTFKVAPILKVIDANDGEHFFAGDDISSAMEATDWYIKTYGNNVPYNAVYAGMVRFYNKFGDSVLEEARDLKRTDTLLVNHALIAVRARDKIVALYNYPPQIVSKPHLMLLTLEADLLLQLNRREEAIESINAWLKRPDGLDDQRMNLDQKLAEITGH